MLINKKKLRIIKLILISSLLHQIILVFYLVSLPIIMSTYAAKRFFNPTGVHDFYAMKSIIFPKSFYNITDYTEIYEYLNFLVGRYYTDNFAYFAPSSAMRISQNRIIRPNYCYINETGVTHFYEENCNLFTLHALDLTNFVSPNIKTCALDACAEYTPQKISTTFKGLYEYNSKVLSVVLTKDKTKSYKILETLKSNNWIDSNTKTLIIDLNFESPEAYFNARGAFEIMDNHVINIYANINRVELSGYQAGKIILLLMYGLPSVVYALRIVYLISVNFSVLTSIFELAHLIVIYCYMAISFATYFY